VSSIAGVYPFNHTSLYVLTNNIDNGKPHMHTFLSTGELVHWFSWLVVGSHHHYCLNSGREQMVGVMYALSHTEPRSC
jgi:hypothetical protein